MLRTRLPVRKSASSPSTMCTIKRIILKSWKAHGATGGKKRDFFKPEFIDGKVKPEGYYVIPIPPPNVTGRLHIGHALATALQDLLIRWARMKNLTVLYLPGCDHAGISTQSVVENMLWRREKKTRHDLGRTAMVERIWQWKGEYHQNIRTVLRRLGGSLDWTREAFTLDENLSRSRDRDFCQASRGGVHISIKPPCQLVYQLQTALSNLESRKQGDRRADPA